MQCYLSTSTVYCICFSLPILFSNSYLVLWSVSRRLTRVVFRVAYWVDIEETHLWVRYVRCVRSNNRCTVSWSVSQLAKGGISVVYQTICSSNGNEVQTKSTAFFFLLLLFQRSEYPFSFAAHGLLSRLLDAGSCPTTD